MCKAIRNISGWFLLILFSSFVGSITLFTHTHEINKVLYVHSHPYDKSESTQHSHTESQLVLLDLFYHSSFQPDIILDIDIHIYPKIEHLLYSWINTNVENTETPSHFRLRAPPAL